MREYSFSIWKLYPVQHFLWVRPSMFSPQSQAQNPQSSESSGWLESRNKTPGENADQVQLGPSPFRCCAFLARLLAPLRWWGCLWQSSAVIPGVSWTVSHSCCQSSFLHIETTGHQVPPGDGCDWLSIDMHILAKYIDWLIPGSHSHSTINFPPPVFKCIFQ